jgi:hypothetical protein
MTNILVLLENAFDANGRVRCWCHVINLVAFSFIRIFDDIGKKVKALDDKIREEDAEGIETNPNSLDVEDLGDESREAEEDVGQGESDGEDYDMTRGLDDWVDELGKDLESQIRMSAWEMRPVRGVLGKVGATFVLLVSDKLTVTSVASLRGRGHQQLVHQTPPQMVGSLSGAPWVGHNPEA